MEARAFWLEQMLKIVTPVLRSGANGTLLNDLPPFNPARRSYAPLEALGRTLCGIAPWLEAEGLSPKEAAMQRECRPLALKAIAAAVDPSGPGFMNFTEGGQPLVDAAFLAHALLRAPRRLFGDLPDSSKKDLLNALKSTRTITPCDNNWLFFSAMVETALCRFGEEWDPAPVHRALKAFEGRYAGDGAYKDGELFRWDYYNSYVIHPMQTDITAALSDKDALCRSLAPVCRERAKRFAAVLERLIMPDGSYPVLGRSSTYRFGAFQILAQAALQGFLPEELSPGAVRGALTAVIARVTEAPGMFTAEGWLTPGVYGRQTGLAEEYINTGSLYLCMAVFLPLGLAPADRFWQAPDEAWTMKRLWRGEDLPRDHAAD